MRNRIVAVAARAANKKKKGQSRTTTSFAGTHARTISDRTGIRMCRFKVGQPNERTKQREVLVVTNDKCISGKQLVKIFSFKIFIAR